MISVYAGTKVRITGTFTNSSGALADPTAAVLTVQRPDGTDDTPATSSSSTGVWTAEYDLSSKPPGIYRYRWAGTGTIVAASEDAFEVLASRVV